VQALRKTNLDTITSAKCRDAGQQLEACAEAISAWLVQTGARLPACATCFQNANLCRGQLQCVCHTACGVVAHASCMSCVALGCGCGLLAAAFCG
jgi:hypothetical protein